MSKKIVFKWHRGSGDEESTIKVGFSFDDDLQQENTKGLLKRVLATRIPCMVHSTLSDTQVLDNVCDENHHTDMNEDTLFDEGINAYNDGDFDKAAEW